MKDIEFIFDGESAIIQSNTEDKMKDIFNIYAKKSGIDIASIHFTFNDKEINEELTLSQLIGEAANEKIKILVNKKDKLISIICPKCNENIKYNFDEKDSKDKLCSNFNIFFDTLERMKNNTPSINNSEHYKNLASMLFAEFAKNNDIKYRELILEKILDKIELLKNSSKLINMIIEEAGINCKPKEIENNTKYLKDEKSKLFLRLNNRKNDFLEEILMNIFERKISKYFELIQIKDEKTGKITNIPEIILDKSFSIFKETIKILDEITILNKEKNEDNKNLLKLYSLVYVKQYLYHAVYYLIYNNEDINSIQEIVQSVNNIKNKAFSKVVKIYILKLIFNFKNRNYEGFKNYEFEKSGINFLKEFESKDNASKMDNILPSILVAIKMYKQILDAFEKISDFNSINKDFEILLGKYEFDLFLIMVLNKVISNLALEENCDKDLYKNYSNFLKIILKNKNYNKELKELLSLFFDVDIYKNNIKPKISNEKGIINSQLYEAILYGFRFCANSLNLSKLQEKDENLFLYPSLLSDRCQKTIENSFIPGLDNNDNHEDLHIATLDLIKKHFQQYSDMFGCYVCSCGYYYTVNPPGFCCTNRSINCLNCGQKIGWGPKVIKDKGAINHGMVVRPGHYRIFKNQAQKIAQMKKWGEVDENFPNMTLDDYIKNIIEPISKEKLSLGFNAIDKEYFEKKDKKIRSLSNIGYRLLNFIVYSHLFFSYCMGKISEEQLNKYLIKNCSILQIIEINWNLLKEALNQKNIDSIQIFINMLFKDLSRTIKKYKISKDKNDLINIESRVENIISRGIQNYPKYSKKYNENQDIDITSLKTLVSEIVPPESGNYSQEEYPLFKYFHYTEYKSENDMLNKMPNKDKYPLIYLFISNYQDLKKLKYLPAFNEFTNYMVNYYNYKISREEAKNRILENEEIVKDKEFDIKFKNFVNLWEHIKSNAVKYLCREDMVIKDTYTLKDKLSYFLNDGKELNNGMYLASACQNFIRWQNEFLREIIESYKDGGILNKYINKNNLLKEIPIQKAQPEQIILIEEKFKKNGDNYIDFNDLIYALSERKIFEDNGKINYSNYNTFSYDYDKIEEELGKIILSDTCLFKNEYELNFVTYWEEGFQGYNPIIIYDLLKKYPQIDLDKKEKEDVINYIKSMNKTNQEKNNNKPYDFKIFFGSLLLILDYLAKETEIKKDEIIVNLIKTDLKHLRLSDDCINFFNNEGKNIKLNKIFDLYTIFEHLLYKDLFAMLNQEFKVLIPEETKNKIIAKLLKNKNSNDLITTNDLAAAIRRFITRYLVGTSQIVDIKEDRKLAFELTREELWKEKIRKSEDLMDLVFQKIEEFKLKVSQAYEIYNLIGEEDRNELNI